jgi:hypothetical protein
MCNMSCPFSLLELISQIPFGLQTYCLKYRKKQCNDL